MDLISLKKEKNYKMTGQELMEENNSTKEKVGDYLKSIRTKQKKSLEQVSQRTKILVTVLSDLENNDLNALPGKTYVRGFAKSYAKEIGADISKTLLLLDELYQVKSPIEGPLKENPRDVIHKFEQDICDLPHGQKKKAAKVSLKIPLYVTLIIICIAVPTYFLVNFLQGPNSIEILKERFSKLKEINFQSANEPAETPHTEAVAAPVEESLAKNEPEEQPSTPNATEMVETPMTAEDLIASTAEVATNETPIPEKEKVQEAPKPVVPPPVVAKEEKKKTEDGQNFQPIPRPLFTFIEGSKEASDPDIFPSHFKSRFNKEKQNVFISAINDETWIRYKKDQDEIKTFTIKKGGHLFIQGDEILLFMGNVNATKIFYNNKLIDPQAPRGVKSLVFPEEKASDYQIPLFVRENDKVYTSLEYKELKN